MRPGHEKKKQTNPGESHVMLTALQQLLTRKGGECTMHGTIFYQHDDTRTQAAGSLFLQCMPNFELTRTSSQSPEAPRGLAASIAALYALLIARARRVA